MCQPSPKCGYLDHLPGGARLAEATALCLRQRECSAWIVRIPKYSDFIDSIIQRLPLADHFRFCRRRGLYGETTKEYRERRFSPQPKLTIRLQQLRDDLAELRKRIGPLAGQ